MRRQIRAAERHLARVDPVLAGLIRHHGPCTLMRDPRPHFHTLVWAIINQQLSVKAAQSIEARLQARLGVAQFEHVVQFHASGLPFASLGPLPSIPA